MIERSWATFVGVAGCLSLIAHPLGKVGIAQTNVDIPPSATLQLQNLTDEPSRADLFATMEGLEREARPADFRTEYALTAGFVFPFETQWDATKKQPRVNSIFGIDISHYTPSSIPLEQMPAFNVRFIYVKATQGSHSKDPKFDTFWQRLENVNVHRGAYHFLSYDPKQDGKSQAIAFLSVLKDSGGLKNTDLPPVLDFEWDKACSSCPDRWKGQDPAKILAKIKDWMTVVEDATGRKPLFYTARSFVEDILGGKDLGEIGLYPADYSQTGRAVEKPHVPDNHSFVLWQFTDKAQLNDVKFRDGVDASIFYGTDADFYQKLHIAKFPSEP